MFGGSYYGGSYLGGGQGFAGLSIVVGKVVKDIILTTNETMLAMATNNRRNVITNKSNDKLILE